MISTPVHKNFLLADDDADDADLFCEALLGNSPSIQCRTVLNGIALFELLSVLNSDLPDIIFLDINMPVMNGWDCLTKLKNSDYSNIPIIMYSTSSAKKDIDKAYELGALLFVTKPEDFRELKKILAVVAANSTGSLATELKEFENVKLHYAS